MEHYILDRPPHGGVRREAHEGPRGAVSWGSHRAWRRRTRVLGAVAGVMILSLAGAGAMTWLFPAGRSESATSRPAPPISDTRKQAPPAARAVDACASCGTVETVRPVEGRGKAVYRVTVRMDDGTYRAISQPVAPGIGPGEKVQIVDGAVVPGR